MNCRHSLVEERDTTLPLSSTSVKSQLPLRVSEWEGAQYVKPVSTEGQYTVILCLYIRYFINLLYVGNISFFVEFLSLNTLTLGKNS